MMGCIQAATLGVRSTKSDLVAESSCLRRRSMSVGFMPVGRRYPSPSQYPHDDGGTRSCSVGAQTPARRHHDRSCSEFCEALGEAGGVSLAPSYWISVVYNSLSGLSLIH